LQRVAVVRAYRPAFAVRAVSIAVHRVAVFRRLGDDAAQRVLQQGFLPARGVAREDFIDLDAGVIGGADAAADQFGYRLAAVVEVADALLVDGFFYPPPEGVVAVAGLEVGAGDLRQSSFGVPGVGGDVGCIGAVAFLDEVAGGIVVFKESDPFI